MDLNQKKEQSWEGDFAAKESSGFGKGKVIFLFVVGFLLGVSIKAQAIKSITMGYDDYKLATIRNDFSIFKAKEETGQAPVNEEAGQTPVEGENEAVTQTK